MEIAVERVFTKEILKRANEFVSCNSGRKATWRF